MRKDKLANSLHYHRAEIFTAPPMVFPLVNNGGTSSLVTCCNYRFMDVRDLPTCNTLIGCCCVVIDLMPNLLFNVSARRVTVWCRPWLQLIEC